MEVHPMKAIVLEACLFGLCCGAASAAEQGGFLLAGTFYGPNPQDSAEVRRLAERGIIDAFDFFPPPLSEEKIAFFQGRKCGVVSLLAAAKEALKSYAALETKELVPTAEFIEAERSRMRRLTAALGGKAWWVAMPEFDSSGHWAGKQIPRPGTSRSQAYRDWMNYYRTREPLGAYLRLTPAERGFHLAAINGYSCFTHYAYELGAELVLLERNNDHIGDIQTGVAFLRGAGRQYGRHWGIDISLWRQATEGGKGYEAFGGWSTSYYRRHLFIAYMSGASMIHLEAGSFFDPQGDLTPFGRMVKDFHDFTARHSDRGEALAPTAVMFDVCHGFEPKCSYIGQQDAVWYRNLPYSDGDYMTHNLLAAAFPDFWLSGTNPGAPWLAPQRKPWWNPPEFRRLLSTGLDRRAFEPMGKSRWGDTIDVILSNAPPAALDRYKVILLVGDITLDARLRPLFRRWVQAGGTLVANIKQVGAADEPLLGVKITGRRGESSRARLPAGKTELAEPAYAYSAVIPNGAAVVADTPQGDPLLTRRVLGQGEVILTTPHFLQGKNHAPLAIGRQMLDALAARCARVRIEGPPLEYLVNEGPGKAVVTLVNNSGRDWHGRLVFARPRGDYRTLDWLVDHELPHREQNGRLEIPADVRPYDLRIIAVESGPAAAHASCDPPAFRSPSGRRPRVVFAIHEDEYLAEKTLPRFAQLLTDRRDCDCTVLRGDGDRGIPGLEALAKADALVLFVRRRALPERQMAMIRAYLDSGKPLVGLRTASHAFALPPGKRAPPGAAQWPTFDGDVLGGSYHGHGPNPAGTDVAAAPGSLADPILSGVRPLAWHSQGSLYYASPIDPRAKVLLVGSAAGKREPIAWTRSYRGSRVFYTSLGHPADFDQPQFQQLLLNALHWATAGEKAAHGRRE
jgi:type 1 glutamine amidotransferase